MQPLILLETAGSIAVRKRKAEITLITAEQEVLSSPGFPEALLMGNFENLLWWRVWYELSQSVKGPELPQALQWLPLSYRSVPKEFEAAVEPHLKRGLKTVRRTGDRNLEHASLARCLAHELLGLEPSRLWIEFKRIHSMLFRDASQLKTDGPKELIADRAALTALSDTACILTEANPLSTEKLWFTRQPVEQMGLRFPRGCVYEGSGYGVSFWYLPDARLSLFVALDAGFAEHFFVLLSLLRDLEYFGDEVDGVLESLSESCRLYPWLHLSLIPGETD